MIRQLANRDRQKWKSSGDIQPGKTKQTACFLAGQDRRSSERDNSEGKGPAIDQRMPAVEHGNIVIQMEWCVADAPYISMSPWLCFIS
jgi:hypothetical protein